MIVVPLRVLARVLVRPGVFHAVVRRIWRGLAAVFVGVAGRTGTAARRRAFGLPGNGAGDVEPVTPYP
jgi:hypothetical protein